MKKLLIVLASLVFMTTVAGASDWVKILETKNGDRFFLDVSSAKISNDKISILDKVIKTDGKYNLGLLSFNCSQKKWRLESTTVYDRDGNLLASFHAPSQWAHIVPDSFGEKTYNILCNDGTPTLNGINNLKMHKEEMK
jgi:hypothetical protein